MHLLILNALVEVLILALAVYFKNRPQKKINDFSGYRTKRSMSSQEAWDLSQTYFGNLNFKYSLFVPPIHLFLFLIFGGLVAFLGMCLFWILILVVCAVKTEALLKKNGF